MRLAMKGLMRFLLVHSRFASYQRPMDRTLILALASTALTIAAAVALVYYHRLDALN
jgi:hypothetical protein